MSRVYTSRARVEDYLKRDLSDHEAQGLPLLIQSATEWINSYLDTDYTDTDDEVERFYDTGGECLTWLDIDPAKEVSEVAHVDQYGNVITTYDPTLYELTPRNKTIKTGIRKRNSRWPEGVSNIRVKGKFTSYNGSIPAAITLAATMLVGDYLQGDQAIKMEEIEGWRVQYQDMPDLTARVTDVLKPYTRILL